MVSTVEPDLLEMTKRTLRSGSTMRRTASGVVLSNTASDGKPNRGPNTRQNTSGARLEPPIPHNTTVSHCSRIRSANSSRSECSSKTRSATSSQPSRFDSSRVAEDAPHTVGSFDQIRCTTDSVAMELNRSWTAESSFPREADRT